MTLNPLISCNNGFCISMQLRCDGRSDCEDNSDEIQCNVLNINSNSYSKDISPPENNGEGLLDIDVKLDLKNIFKIDEVDRRLHVAFGLELYWYDSRLTFNNLKQELNLNVLTSEQIQQIWIPQLIFVNTQKESKTTIDEATVRVYFDSNQTYELAPMTSNENIFLFKGSEHQLDITQHYDQEFVCDFHLEGYPFDVQECDLVIALSEVHDQFCRLVDRDIFYSGDVDLRTNYIRYVTLKN